MVQILHRGVSEIYSAKDNQEVSIGVRRSDERFVECLIGFHQIHAGDRRQVDFGGVLHLSEGTPYRAGRNSHQTILLTRAAALSSSDAGLPNNSMSATESTPADRLGNDWPYEVG